MSDPDLGGFEVVTPDVMYVAHDADTSTLRIEDWVEDGMESIEGVPHRVFRRPDVG